MSRWAWFPVSFLLLGAASLLVNLNGCGGGTGSFTVPPPGSKIQHVVIIFQENRAPDNLFQGLCIPPYGQSSACSTSPSGSQYNIASSGVNSQQQTIQLSPIDLGTVGANPDNYDLNHAHISFTKMCDLNPSTGVCKMDGADLIKPSCGVGITNCAPANPQFMYVIPSDVVPYLQLAQQYTFADRMFQTNQGPSFPAHQFIISGTSAPLATSSLFAAENVENGGAAGCIAPPTETVEMIDAAGSESSTPPMYPCFEHQTLTDLLDAANISWRYYAPSAGSIWTAPDAIQHMCGPNAAPPNATQCVGSDWTGTNPKVVLGQTQANAQILTDIANNQLAQVSWVIPEGRDSDHALSNNGCGPSWVTSIVDAIGNSPYWSNTAIILTWDDWGGWYDHVAPQVINDGVSWGSGYVYGFRVPLIVMSPYARAGYVSHVTHDFGSILKFVEKTFNLPSLNYADKPADNLADVFNFNQAAIQFQTIPPPANNATCLASDTGAASDPDDD